MLICWGPGLAFHPWEKNQGRKLDQAGVQVEGVGSGAFGLTLRDFLRMEGNGGKGCDEEKENGGCTGEASVRASCSMRDWVARSHGEKYDRS